MAWKDFLKSVKNTDRRRKEEELLKEHILCILTKSDLDFVKERAKIECNSMNGIIRRCIRDYKANIESHNKDNTNN